MGGISQLGEIPSLSSCRHIYFIFILFNGGSLNHIAPKPSENKREIKAVTLTQRITAHDEGMTK